MNDNKRTTEIDLTSQSKKKASKYVMTNVEKKELTHTVSSNSVALFLLGYVDRAEGTSIPGTVAADPHQQAVGLRRRANGTLFKAVSSHGHTFYRIH